MKLGEYDLVCIGVDGAIVLVGVLNYILTSMWYSNRKIVERYDAIDAFHYTSAVLLICVVINTITFRVFVGGSFWCIVSFWVCLLINISLVKMWPRLKVRQ